MKTKAQKHNGTGFASGAMVLAVSSIVAKFLGAVYRIPLTNVLGAEGMGLYQLVFPIYALFLTLSTSGMPTALSRLVAEKKASGLSGKKYLVAVSVLMCAFCLSSALLILVLSNLISVWQGNGAIGVGYVLIAPAIVFVGGIAVLRGWFQGNFNMVPTAVSNIIEQAGKLAVGLTLAVVLAKNCGTVVAVYGALVGVTLSEVAAFLYLLIRYFMGEKRNKRFESGNVNVGEKRNKSVASGNVNELSMTSPTVLSLDETPNKEGILADYKRKRDKGVRPSRTDFKALSRVAFPIALVSIMLPLSQFADSFLIVNLLKVRGLATATATAQYGLLSGPVSSLINLPIVIMLSLAIAVVPTVSAGRVARDLDGILKKSALSIKLTYLIGIPSAIFYLVFARPILALLYPTLSAENLSISVVLLSINCASVVFLSATQVYTALLQALDKTLAPVRNLGIAVLIKIGLTALLTRYFGIVGSAAASLAMSAVAFVLNATSFRNYIGRDVKLVKNVGAILLTGVIMGLFGYALTVWISSAVVALAVGALVSIVFYGAVVLAGNIVEDGELVALPLGGFMLKMKKGLRFWE